MSGGLDSTHALIVAAKAMDRLRRPRTDILGFTLPGFATGARTKGNAHRLAEALGITFAELDITSTAVMLSALGHPFGAATVYDVTFENVQSGCAPTTCSGSQPARRIVLGNRLLSDCLGWSTYGVGYHMSHST